MCAAHHIITPPAASSESARLFSASQSPGHPSTCSGRLAGRTSAVERPNRHMRVAARRYLFAPATQAHGDPAALFYSPSFRLRLLQSCPCDTRRSLYYCGCHNEQQIRRTGAPPACVYFSTHAHTHTPAVLNDRPAHHPHREVRVLCGVDPQLRKQRETR